MDRKENLTPLNVESLPVTAVNPALAFRPVLFQKLPTNPEIGRSRVLEAVIQILCL